jgi:hypothetical protein
MPLRGRANSRGRTPTPLFPPDRDPVEETDPRHAETVRVVADGAFKAQARTQSPRHPSGSRNSRFGPSPVVPADSHARRSSDEFVVYTSLRV